MGGKNSIGSASTLKIINSLDQGRNYYVCNENHQPHLAPVGNSFDMSQMVPGVPCVINENIRSIVSLLLDLLHLPCIPLV